LLKVIENGSQNQQLGSLWRPFRAQTVWIGFPGWRAAKSRSPYPGLCYVAPSGQKAWRWAKSTSLGKEPSLATEHRAGHSATRWIKHASLLPSFQELHAQRQALEHMVRVYIWTHLISPDKWNDSCPFGAKETIMTYVTIRSIC
jgi:hypothetical protein